MIEVAALAISIAALLLSGLVALAVMELVADRTSAPDPPAEDTIEEFELPAAVGSTIASSHGLPALVDHTRTHVMLVVSPVCATCQKLVASFEGAIPYGLTVLVTASTPERMRTWASAQGLALDDLVFDDDMSIVEGLGVASSPSAVAFVHGYPRFAAHLGGRAALDRLMELRPTMFDRAPG